MTRSRNTEAAFGRFFCLGSSLLSQLAEYRRMRGVCTDSVCVLGTRAISHAQSLEPNRVINRDRCRDGRLALALVQGSGTASRILTAPHLSKVNPLSFARDSQQAPGLRERGLRLRGNEAARKFGMQKDLFIREKFTKEQSHARQHAKEYFERYPKDRYQTEVESWRELQSRNIEFTMKRLREPLK
jgi:hypothetical protein